MPEEEILDWLKNDDKTADLEIPPPLSKDTPIIVDSREPEDAYNLLVREFKVPAVVKQLEDGDYVIADWYFSRKTIKDFFGSRNSGHLDDELDRLIKNYTNICLIVEKDQWNTRPEMAIVHKAMDTMKFLMPVLFTASLRDTMEKLVYYRTKIIRHELNYRKRRVMVTGHPNPVISLYCNLARGIGGNIARRIYDKYPKPMDLLDAIKETAVFDPHRWKKRSEWKANRWCAGIEGIGDVLAERVALLIVEGEWKRDEED